MNTRRDFVKFTAVGAIAVGSLRGREGAVGNATQAPAAPATGADDRAMWCKIAGRLATPLLESLAQRQLRSRMPVESAPGVTDRAEYTYLEGLGRLLCGLAPWLELGADNTAEGAVRARLASLARSAIDAGTDPQSPDFMNFARGGQPLVDAAFLAQAMLRAPGALWGKLDPRVQANLVSALHATRRVQPYESNWVLFSAEIEAFLHRVGQKRDEERLFSALKKHQAWYLGDGMYGDGPQFHWDYYNAFVIQPMLVDCLDVVGDETAEWTKFRAQVRERLTRFAAVQERLVAPDGTYPAIGRSIAYRCGAFQGLALAALRHLLPAEVKPAQARVALSAVIRRTLETSSVWDEKSWLKIGLSGAQPGLGERYISTGSLYLCAAAFLPLGLPASDPFWSAPAEKTTWEKAWSGTDLPADHAL